MEATDQPATPGGVRIADGTRDGGGFTFDLIDVLDAIEPLVSGLTWEARCISSVCSTSTHGPIHGPTCHCAWMATHCGRGGQARSSTGASPPLTTTVTSS
jgi:hypothetical protein